VSSNNFKLIFIVPILLILNGCGTTPSIAKYKGKNDTAILMALDSDINKDYKKSLYYYELLYKNTDNIEYLKDAIDASYQSKQITKMETLVNIGLKKYPKQQQYFLTQHIVSLLAQSKPNLALDEAKKLLQLYPSELSYQIIANIYYATKKYSEALKYYESAYALNQTQKNLLSLVDILYTNLNKKDKALAYLETYIQNHKCMGKVCQKLMLIYQEQGDVDGMIVVLTKMYNYYKSNSTTNEMALMVKKLILSLLDKQHIDKTIRYLELNQLDTKKLINLYYQKGDLKKALFLTKKLYNKNNDPVLLGKIAIFRFELAKDKRKVLKNVIANFELALSSGINIAQYQNYYGYLLIDYDVDIKKGISLIKQALKNIPNNVAYKDSLAWGYYKLHKCNKAYILMKEVVQTVGLTDSEIKKHWDKIDRCNIKK